MGNPALPGPPTVTAAVDLAGSDFSLVLSSVSAVLSPPINLSLDADLRAAEAVDLASDEPTNSPAGAASLFVFVSLASTTLAV
jgi:hypothetical protein